jgi:tripartite-type tricarboxylate transporter receptor subunit TctC
MQFKQLLAGALAALALASHAELPKTMKVYIASQLFIPLCNTFFTEYDRVYGTKSIITFKPGASQTIAMKAMQAEPEFSAMFITGYGDHVANRYIYPGNDAAFDDLKVVGSLFAAGTTFVTSGKSPYNTLPELLKQNKEITVGFHSIGTKTIGAEVLKNTKVIWVQHKTSTDAVASLADGTLDLYIDGAGLLGVIESGRLKSLGNINMPNALPGIDLRDVYPSTTKIKQILTVSVSGKNTAQDIAEFEARVKHIQALSVVQEGIRTVGYVPSYVSAKDSEAIFQNLRSLYVKQ